MLGQRSEIPSPEQTVIGLELAWALEISHRPLVRVTLRLRCNLCFVFSPVASRLEMVRYVEIFPTAAVGVIGR